MKPRDKHIELKNALVELIHYKMVPERCSGCNFPLFCKECYTPLDEDHIYGIAQCSNIACVLYNESQ